MQKDRDEHQHGQQSAAIADGFALQAPEQEVRESGTSKIRKGRHGTTGSRRIYRALRVPIQNRCAPFPATGDQSVRECGEASRVGKSNRWQFRSPAQGTYLEKARIGGPS